MAKRLSENKTADLSVHAQDSEDAADAAQEGRAHGQESWGAKRRQARAADTKRAIEKVNQTIQSVGDTAGRKLGSAVRAKKSAGRHERLESKAFAEV